MVHSGNVGGGEINAEWRDLGDIQGPWALKTVQVESKEHCRWGRLWRNKAVQQCLTCSKCGQPHAWRPGKCPLRLHLHPVACDCWTSHKPLCGNAALDPA